MVGWLSEFLWHKVQKGHAAPDKSLKGRNDEKKKVKRNTFTEIKHIHISIKELDGVFHPEVASTDTVRYRRKP